MEKLQIQMTTNNKKLVISHVNNDKKFINKVLTLLDQLKNSAMPCTGGKRITFTNKEWKNFEKIHEEILNKIKKN
jgi:hypothetical protein